MHTALIGRALTAASGIVLVVVGPALPHTDSLSAVVGHEQHHRIAGHIGVGFQIIENVAQTLVHALHQSGMIDFLLIQHGIKLLVVIVGIVGRKARVGIVRRVDGIVRHVEIERLVALNGFFNGLEGLNGQRFGEERAGAVILFETRHVETAGPVFIFGQITARPAIGRTGNIDIEAKLERVGPRRGFGAEMCLAAMDGIVAVVVQDLRQRRHGRTVREVVRIGHTSRLNAVVVPVGQRQHTAGSVGLGVVVKRPVGHAVTRGIHT